MINIVTVLHRPNEACEFTAQHVNLLYERIRRFCWTRITQINFHCLTNAPNGLKDYINVVPIPNDGVIGWFNKLRVFDKKIFPEGRFLLFDLDMLPVRDLGPIFDYKGDFCMVVDPTFTGEFWSATQLYDVEKFHYLWDNFDSNKGKWLEWLVGDQNYLNFCLHNFSTNAPNTSKLHLEFSQFRPNKSYVTPLPSGWFPSYKYHRIDLNHLPKEAYVVVFHGKPRPWEVTVPF